MKLHAAITVNPNAIQVWRKISSTQPAPTTGGSSSGIGTAANFPAGNAGTETAGSMGAAIVAPTDIILSTDPDIRDEARLQFVADHPCALRSGQLLPDISDEMDLMADRARYQADRAKDIALSAPYGIDEVMKANNLDALLFPEASGAVIAAKRVGCLAVTAAYAALLPRNRWITRQITASISSKWIAPPAT